MSTISVPSAPAATTPARRKKRIVVADELGYCWGVRRALDIITRRLRAKGRSRRSATSSTTRRSSSGCGKGVEGADIGRAGQDARFYAGRDHGPRHGSASGGAGSRQQMQLIDTTCPLVTKVQRLAQKLVRQGYYLVVYGDSYHPEVQACSAGPAPASQCAAKKIADLPWNATRGAVDRASSTPPRKVAVVSQTTKNVDELMKFAQELQAMVVPEGGEFRLCNTICEPTSERQNALKRLVEEDQRRPDPGDRRPQEQQHRAAGRGRQLDGGHVLSTSSGPRISSRRGWTSECGRGHGRRIDAGRRDRGYRRLPGRPRLRAARRWHPQGRSGLRPGVLIGSLVFGHWSFVLVPGFPFSVFRYAEWCRRKTRNGKPKTRDQSRSQVCSSIGVSGPQAMMASMSPPSAMTMM